jgi:hypothetical protein
MNQICLWCITAVTAIISLHTLWLVYCQRQRFFKDNLNDSDSAFVWRLVIFLVFPLLKLFDLRTVTMLCQNLGGHMVNGNYGLFWYQGTPMGLPSQATLIPVLFSGEVAVSVLTILLLPSLLFRPHPFLAMLVGYIAAFVPALYLFIEPALYICGLSNSSWQQAIEHGDQSQIAPLIAIHLTLAFLYIALLKSDWLNLWFSGLIKPISSEKLKKVLASNECRDNAKIGCYLSILFEQAGLRKKALKQLRQIKDACPDSLYTIFAEAFIAYRKRDYKSARSFFVRASDYLNVDGQLKGSLLAAAACCAFAEGKRIDALNLSERSLEFDDYSLIARMVKVDVFLAQGKQKQASNELYLAMKLGLSHEIEDKIPLDVEKVFKLISHAEEKRAAREAIYALSSN